MARRVWPGVVACALLGMVWSACSSDPASRQAKFLARGTKYFARHDYNRAILEFTNATQPKPRDAGPWYQLGLAYLAAHRPGDAVAALRKATELNPKLEAAQLKLAELMAQSKDPGILKQALERLDQVLVAQPGDPETLDTVAWAELELDKPEDAEKHLQEVLSRFPGELRASATLAAMQLARGQKEAAEQTLKQAVAKAPRSPDAARALAFLYIKEKKSAEAEKELQRALELKPGDVLSLRFLAALQLSEGKQNDADQTYRRLASIPDANLAYIHAAFLMQEGRNAEAIAEFEKLVKRSPTDHAMMVRLVAAYLRVGRSADAVKRITGMLRSNPKDTDALLFRSRLDLASGRTADAEADILQVLHFEPESADAHYGMSVVYGLEGMSLNRLSELDKVVKLRPNAIGPRVELARAQIAAGHADTALAVMDSTPQSLKDTIPAIVGRNWALLALNRLDEARTSLQRGLQIQKSFDLLFQQGVLQMMRNDLSAAQATADELMRMRPSSVVAVDFAVKVRVAQHQNAEALRILHESIARSPKSVAMQYLAGTWYGRLNDGKEARAALATAEALDPRYSPARVAEAVLDIHEGKLDLARSALSTVTAAQPKNETAELLLGNVELKANNRESALAHYRKAAELNSDNVAALNAAAYLLAMQDPDQALKYAQRALDLAPNDPSVEDTMGSVYYHKGLYSEAVEYLALATSKDPTAVHQFHFAMSCFKIGDRERGQENLLKALAKDPKLPQTESGW